MSFRPSGAVQTVPIRSCPIPEAVQPFYLYEDDQDIKSHPSYRAAKAGDAKAALILVSDLALSPVYEARDRFPKGCVFVAPHAKEVFGDNAIPQVLAEVCAIVCGTVADTDIVQVTKVYHTGADPMERLISRPVFEGRVEPNKRYVLVDDVTSLGGTLAELAHYIQSHGATVCDVVVLVNAGRNKALQPSKVALRTLETRYPNELVQIFGIAFEALTANEAQYLVGFRTVDEIRNRVVKAKQEIRLRLRSKGVSDLDPAQD